MQEPQPTDGDLTISGAFQYAVDTFLKNWGLLLAVQATMAAPQLLSAILLPSSTFAIGPLSYGPFVAVAVQSPMWGGYLSILVALANGETPVYSDLFKKTGLFWKYLLVSTINFLAVVIGCCFLLVPGIIAAIHLTFSTVVVAVEDRGPIEAVLRSSELTRGYRWQLFGIFAVQSVIMGVAGAVFIGIPLGIIGAVSHTQVKSLTEVVAPPMMVPLLIFVGLILGYCYRQMVIAHPTVVTE